MCDIFERVFPLEARIQTQEESFVRRIVDTNLKSFGKVGGVALSHFCLSNRIQKVISMLREKYKDQEKTLNVKARTRVMPRQSVDKSIPLVEFIAK